MSWEQERPTKSLVIWTRFCHGISLGSRRRESRTREQSRALEKKKKKRRDIGVIQDESALGVGGREGSTPET